MMFKPKNEKPYWRMIYEEVEDKQVGDVISYPEIEKILGKELSTSRAYIYRASKELLRKQHRMLEVKPNVGYEVVEGMDIYDSSDKRVNKGKRQVKTAGFQLENIATATLSPDDKKKVKDFMMYNSAIRRAFSANARAIEEGVQATNVQLAGANAQLAGAQITQLFTEEQVKKLKEMLGE